MRSSLNATCVHVTFGVGINPDFAVHVESSLVWLLNSAMPWAVPYTQCPPRAGSMSAWIQSGMEEFHQDSGREMFKSWRDWSGKSARSFLNLFSGYKIEILPRVPQVMPNYASLSSHCSGISSGSRGAFHHQELVISPRMAEVNVPLPSLSASLPCSDSKVSVNSPWLPVFSFTVLQCCFSSCFALPFSPFPCPERVPSLLLFLFIQAASREGN